MKKFSPRAVIVVLLASFFGALVVSPAYASAPDVYSSSLTYFARVGESVNGQMHPTFTATGFSGSPTFTVSPALPSGLTINSSTGEITGTPTAGIDTTTFTVTATYNSEVDSTSFDMAVGQGISITSTVSSVTPNAVNPSTISISFGHTSIINNANGVITVVLGNSTPASPGSCTGVTLSPAASTCSLILNGSTYTYEFTGVDFSNPASTFTMSFASGTLTAGNNGYLYLNVNLANGSNVPSLNFGAPTISIGSGQNQQQQQQNQSTPFTAGTATTSRGSSPSFSTLAVGANSPAYTSTFSGFSTGAVVDQVNFLLGDPYNGVFWSVPGAVTNNGSNYATWNPSSNTCGISAIRIGGVSQTASSGITCLKSTAATTPVQYWISFKLSNPTTAEISYDVAPGAFVVTQAGNYNFFTTLFDNSASPRKLASITQAFDATQQSSPAELVSFSLPVAVGQRIVGEDVAITATDLALSTDYSVVLRSTPQVLAQGRTVSSSFNTSVTIPDNLEPGWHSITFSATRSDGAALEEKVYFKINADGTLLASSTVIPAELAFTAAFTAGAIPLSLIVLVLGFIAFFVAREINPDFMRVMTLTRNENGELDFIKRRIRSVDF